MSNEFSITIQNNSGQGQTYSLFQKKPLITTAGTSPAVWSTVVLAGSAAEQGSAQFSISGQSWAVIGSSSGALENNVKVRIFSNKKVTLGSTNNNGSVIPGTTLKMVVDDASHAPRFSSDQQPDGSKAGAFEFTTASFARNDAIRGNWLIGMASGVNFGDAIPAAVIFPEPSSDFQIQPSNTWIIVPGNYQAGTVVDYAKVGTMVEVDTSKIPSGNANIVHGPNGNLYIQK